MICPPCRFRRGASSRRSTPPPNTSASRPSRRWSACSARAVSTVFNLWMRVSTPVVEQLGWYDQIEPYVGYGTEAYSRLICRTVYAPEHHRPGARIRGIWGHAGHPRAPPPRARGHRRHTAGKLCRSAPPNPTTNRTPSAGRPPSTRYPTPPVTSTSSPSIASVPASTASPTGSTAANRSPPTCSPSPAAPRSAIISDVDDTIMITQVPTLWKAAYNVLFANPKKRASVPGMSVLFTKLAALFPEAPFFYLSTSPWNVESSIRHFINDHGFLPARCCCGTWTRAPRPSSPPACSTSSNSPNSSWATSPDMKFILIGDDGQKDPTTYATIARRYPGRVIAIGIRQLSPREASPLGSVARGLRHPADARHRRPRLHRHHRREPDEHMLPYLERFA